MNKFARMAGVLFLVSTAAYLIGNGLMDPVLNHPGFLARMYPDRTNVISGSLLELINAIAVVGIAVLLFPILKKHNEAFALGYFGFRIMESALLIISAIGPLVLIVLSKSYLSVDTAKGSYFETIGNLVIVTHDVLFQTAMIMLGSGSLLLCYVLYRTRLVPRFLSVIGLIGYSALLASSCLTILGLEIGSVLYIPGAIFEIMFPVWAIVKGFNLHRDEFR